MGVWWLLYGAGSPTIWYSLSYRPQHLCYNSTLTPRLGASTPQPSHLDWVTKLGLQHNPNPHGCRINSPSSMCRTKLSKVDYWSTESTTCGWGRSYPRSYPIVSISTWLRLAQTFLLLPCGLCYILWLVFVFILYMLYYTEYWFLI